MKKLFTFLASLACASVAFGQAAVTRGGAGGLVVQQASLVFTTPVVGVASGTSLTLSGLIASATSTASTSYTSPLFSSNNADPADAGVIRLGNAEVIAWEASPAGTDVTFTVNSSEQFVFSAPLLVNGATGVLFGTSASIYAPSLNNVSVRSVGSDVILNLSANGTDVALFGVSGSNTYLDYTGILNLRSGFGGSTKVTIAASGDTAFVGQLAINGAAASSTTALIVPASTTGVSSLRVPHGSAPTSPVNGDLWTTTTGIFGRINGSTVGPLAAGGSGTVASGTTNKLAKYTAATTVGDSAWTDDGTTATYGGTGGITSAGAATGILQVTGVTSGAFKITGADAMAQTVTMSLAAQTVGAATVTIPDMANVSDTFSFLGKAQTITGAKTFGSAGAVGKLIVAGTTSGTTIINAAAVAGSTTTTLPNANSTLPIYPQQITYTGPTAARTVTYPDAAFTVARTDAANVFTGTQDIVATGVRLTGSNGSLTFLGLGSGADEDLKLDLDTTTNTATFTSSTGVTTAAFGAIGITTTGTSSVGPLVDSVDGTTPLHSITAAYAAGTAYSLTATSAAIDFGTTDPVIVPVNAGTYLLYGRVVLKYNGATFAANRTVTLKIRRTNNTAADVANSTSVLTTGVISGITATFLEVSFPPVLYTTTNLNDSLTIFADVDVVPSVGTLDASAASLVASRQY